MAKKPPRPGRDPAAFGLEFDLIQRAYALLDSNPDAARAIHARLRAHTATSLLDSQWAVEGVNTATSLLNLARVERTDAEIATRAMIDRIDAAMTKQYLLDKLEAKLNGREFSDEEFVRRHMPDRAAAPNAPETKDVLKATKGWAERILAGKVIIPDTPAPRRSTK
jgi:hypothetical protein